MQSCARNVEEQQAKEECVIESIVKSAFLTYAFQNSESFRLDLNFSLSFLGDCVHDGGVEGLVTRNALLNQNESSKAFVVRFFYLYLRYPWV